MGLAEGDLNTVTVCACLSSVCRVPYAPTLWPCSGVMHTVTLIHPYPSFTHCPRSRLTAQHSTRQVSQVTSFQLCELLYCGTLHIMSWLTSVCGTLWFRPGSIFQCRRERLCLCPCHEATSLSTSPSSSHRLQLEDARSFVTSMKPY
jgi:hypothetical protein